MVSIHDETKLAHKLSSVSLLATSKGTSRKCFAAHILRRYVFETHVTVKYFSAVSFITTTRSVLLGVQQRQRAQQGPVLTEGSWNKHKANTATCSSYRYLQQHSWYAAWEYAIRDPGRRPPDVNMFRSLDQRLHRTGNITPTTHVNVISPRTVQTPASEDATIAAEEWSRFLPSQPRLVEVLHDYQLHSYQHSRSAYSFPISSSMDQILQMAMPSTRCG